MLVDDRELTDRAARIETLLGEVASFPDAGVRDKATEIVESLLLLYGEGLARMLDRIADRTDEDVAASIFEAFAEDELIAHLLCLHDLHPVSVETRVARALEQVRPYLESHGGNVELLGVVDGVARLRLQGSCSGCPSSTMTLKLAIEEAIQKAAPDLDGIEAEGVAEPPKPANFISASDLIQLSPRRDTEPAPRWVDAGTVDGPDPGELRSAEVAGIPLLFVRVQGSLLAYRNACPRCGRAIDGGILRGTELSCSSCGDRYDVRKAGQCLDSPHRHLEPVPLLEREGRVTVALDGAREVAT